MDDSSLSFLKRLLDAPGPSGFETIPARIWREEAERVADRVEVDVSGNSLATLNAEGGPHVMLAGHIDEIGLMLTHVDEDGFLYFEGIGGWDPQVLVAQRVRILARGGEVLGVVGKKPIHLIKGDEKEKASKIEDLWIDIGAKNRAEAAKSVRVGTVGVIDASVYDFPNGRIVSRSIDDRIGAFTVLEALRLLSQDRPKATVAAVATCQEETTFAGAQTAAFSYNPHVAIAVDVTFATDHPGADKKQHGDVKLGGGPVLARGAANSPAVYDMLLKLAEREGIPYSVQITPRTTGTDADAIHMARGGVATAVISIPNRYMHSPNEMVELADVENAAKLIAAFVRSLSPDTDFVPR